MFGYDEMAESTVDTTQTTNGSPVGAGAAEPSGAVVSSEPPSDDESSSPQAASVNEPTSARLVSTRSVRRERPLLEVRENIDMR